MGDTRALLTEDSKVREMQEVIRDLLLRALGASASPRIAMACLSSALTTLLVQRIECGTDNLEAIRTDCRTLSAWYANLARCETLDDLHAACQASDRDARLKLARPIGARTH